MPLSNFKIMLLQASYIHFIKKIGGEMLGHLRATSGLARGMRLRLPCCWCCSISMEPMMLRISLG